MKINPETEEQYEMPRDHRARAAGWISWTGSTPSSHFPSNITSNSSSTSATTSGRQRSPSD
jgi:hypothetical protein